MIGARARAPAAAVSVVRSPDGGDPVSAVAGHAGLAHSQTGSAGPASSGSHPAPAGRAGPDRVSGLVQSQTAEEARATRKRKRFMRRVARSNAVADLDGARRRIELGTTIAIRAIEDAHRALQDLFADEGQQDSD